MNSLRLARHVIDTEIAGMQAIRAHLGDDFLRIVSTIASCRGKLVITGMGKAGHVGKKIAATMASLGTSSFFMHPAEGLHGDLGMLQPQDILFLISFSGESKEITQLLPSVRLKEIFTIGLTGNPDSVLAKSCDLVEVLPPIKEACLMGLAPTTSTTVVLAYGDALAVTLSEIKQFNQKQFAISHPLGSLGKQLTLFVKDLMVEFDSSDCLQETSFIAKAITMLSKYKTILLPVAEKNRMTGILTDGGLNRLLSRQVDVYSATIADEVEHSVVYVPSDASVHEALIVLSKNNLQAIPVLEGERPIGLLYRKAILDSGVHL